MAVRDLRDAAGSRPDQVRSVDRALAILEMLGSSAPRALTLSEIAKTLAMSKSATLALLKTLAQRDFVVKTDVGGGPRYRLGFALARLGDRAVTQDGLLDRALPILERLTDETGRTSRIGVLDGGYIVVLGRTTGPGFIQVRTRVGRREYAHCSALGKATLSQLPDAEIVEIATRVGLPARTRNTITDAKALLREIRKTRAAGYALDDEEDNLGVFCIGAPVFDHRDVCIGAISITDIKVASQRVPLAELADSVVRHARELSSLLGATPAP